MTTTPDICPMCGAAGALQSVAANRVYGGQPEQAFYCCGVCDVTHIHPRFTTEENEQFFRETYPAFMDKRVPDKDRNWQAPEAHIARNRHQYDRRLKYLEPHLPGRGSRVLDVGCASGFMLFPLAPRGIKCVGVEPAEDSRLFLNDKGIPCFPSVASLAADAVGGGGFDLIMHFFVLDHVPDPKSFLEEQLALLKPGGKIIFEVNNTGDPLLSVYDIPDFRDFYFEAAHYFFFSESALRRLLVAVGQPFEIELDQRYDLSNHLTWALDGKPGGTGRFSDMLGDDLETAYKWRMIETRTCDTLIGIIEK